MRKDSIAFIGGGNMTRAIAGGLLSRGIAADNLLIAEPHAAQRDVLTDDLPGVEVIASNVVAAARAGTLVLAVKPQILPELCAELRETVRGTKPLVVSIAAGVRSDDIDAWLGGGLAVVRVMPNQPALLGKGVSGIYANERTSREQLETASEIMAAVGVTVHVDREHDIDAITAISGSGPAYVFLLIDMLEKAARRFGLPRATARLLATETARGSAELAATIDEPMDTLIARVRSPGGTTAAALDVLERENFRDIFLHALTAAKERAGELAQHAGSTRQ